MGCLGCLCSWTATGLLAVQGEVPMRPVAVPEKTELLDEVVKVVCEQVVVVSSISDYSITLSPTDIFTYLYLQDVFSQIWLF